MAAQVLYLDVDDEITSAVARIRQAPDGGVVVVVPYGSRLASSRINFRLLAREAGALGRPIVVVAPDAGTRALAASAGLATHATVLEWEQAGSPLGAAQPAGAAGPAGPAGRTEAMRGLEPGRAIEAAGGGAGPERGAGAARSDASSSGGIRAGEPPRGWAQLGLDGEETAPAAAGGRGRAGRAGSAVGQDARAGAGGLAGPQPAPAIPVIGGRRTGRTRALVVALVVLLVVVGAGLAATAILPSAEITVIPAAEAVGPLTLTVTGDPAAATADVAKGIVPAVRMEWPLGASATFQSTGKLVTDTKATGSVTFTSLDTGRVRTLAAGTVVRTADGIEFLTAAAVNVPRATIIVQPSLTISPGTASATVTAAKAGPEGNVAAGAIKVIANNPDATLLSVTNPAATSGGVHTESPQVQKADVDAALASLRTRLNDAYAAKVEDPNAIPPGTVLVAGTQKLGDATPSVDPASLVGQQAAAFDLGLNATATAIAVNPAPVTGIAETRLAATAGAGYELVAASTRITVDPPVASGETVTFAVRARGERVRDIDPDALRAAVLGKSIAAARSILQPYGEVRIKVWPDWVTAVPGSDGRVTLTVSPAPTASPAPTPTPAPTPRPSGSPVPSSAAPASPAATPRPSGSAGPAPSASKK